MGRAGEQGQRPAGAAGPGVCADDSPAPLAVDWPPALRTVQGQPPRPVRKGRSGAGVAAGSRWQTGRGDWGEAEGRSQTDASGLRRPPGARRPGRPVAVAGPARGGTRTAGRGPHGGDGPRPRRPPGTPTPPPPGGEAGGQGRGGAVPRQAAGRPRFSPGRRARGRVAAPAGLTAQKGGRLQAGGPRPLDAAPSGPHSWVLAPLTLSFCSPLKASRGCAHTSGFPASPGSFPKPGAGWQGEAWGLRGPALPPRPVSTRAPASRHCRDRPRGASPPGAEDAAPGHRNAFSGLFRIRRASVSETRLRGRMDVYTDLWSLLVPRRGDPSPLQRLFQAREERTQAT